MLKNNKHSRLRVTVFLLAVMLVTGTAVLTAHADDISYIYDAQNRLVEVHYPDRTIKYTYDAAGNRITTTVEVASASPTPTPTPAQTDVGSNVAVQVGTTSVRFSAVTTAGMTNVLPLNTDAVGLLPSGYQIDSHSLAFDVTTTATVQPPIIPCFNVDPAITENDFSLLRVLHNENGVFIDRTISLNFNTKTICASVSTLSVFVIATATDPQITLVLEESGPAVDQVATVDSVTLLRDPLSVLKTEVSISGPNGNRTLVVFADNLQLAQGETAAAVTIILTDSNNQVHEIAAEDVRALPNVTFKQVIFRLPDMLPAGACTVRLRLHSLLSNAGTFKIKTE